MKEFLIRFKKKLFYYKWELICLSLSIIILFIFFGKLIADANHVYFSADGDGLQTYYSSVYHAKYDDSFFHQKNMNYPYGENVFFTACQPIVLAPLKILHLGNYVIGTMNLLMLFSIAASALFIYLVFRECGFAGLWPCLLAVCIAYLSPQINRLSGHYTLTYQFAIPAFIWLLLKFDKNSTYKTSISIAVFVFMLASIHLYFFAFFLLIAMFYGLYYLLSKRNGTYLKTFLVGAKHLLIMLIAPYVLLQLILFFTDTVTDRTNNPWGVLEYKTNWNGVFFPYSKPLDVFFREHFFDPVDTPSWEGIAYVGLFGTLIAVVFALKVLRDLLNFHFKNILHFSDIKSLNYFILAAIIALFYSFGYPFIFKHEDWLEYLGPFKQMRGIARFSWVFFYIINIAGGIFLLSKIKKNSVKHVLLFIATCLLAFDAYNNVNKFQNVLHNRFRDLEETSNNTSNFVWLRSINQNDYQAIIPLPYYHIGSENIGIEPRGQIKKWFCLTSLKTGWPGLASSFSRTSLGQTAENFQITLEPDLVPKWINDLPNKKPFIVIYENGAALNENEKRLIRKASLITQAPDIAVYKLTVDSLRSLYAAPYKEVSGELNTLTATGALNNYDGYLYAGRTKDFVIRSFADEKGKGLVNGNSLLGFGKQYSVLYEDTLPAAKVDSTYLVSVWVNRIKKDLYPRILFIVDLLDSNRIGKANFVYNNVNSRLKRIEGDWGLIETDFKITHKKDIVKVCFYNECLPKKDSTEFDELLIRPAGAVIYKGLTPELIYKNNRLIHKIN